MIGPSPNPTVQDFRCVDDAGQDYAITPGGTIGVQDSGNFEFTTDADNSTYSIIIDVDKDGQYGDAGDVRLNGVGVKGLNQVPWDGLSQFDEELANGAYLCELELSDRSGRSSAGTARCSCCGNSMGEMWGF